MTKSSSVLTSLSFGVHSPRRCQSCALLTDHENKRFVIIVFRGGPQQADGRFGKALQHVVRRIWDKNNPFSWGEESPAHRVVALEIEWSAIVGLDYRCPLHDDGKLVLEARQVVKRCFKSVEDVRDFYSPRTTALGPSYVLRSVHSAAPTPCKLTAEGWQGPLPTRSTAAGSVICSPRFARPASCGYAGLTSGPAQPSTVTDRAAASAASMRSVNGRSNRLTSGSEEELVAVSSRDPRVPHSHAPLSRSISASRMGRSGGASPGDVGNEAAGMRRVVSFAAARSSCSGFASADEGSGGGRRQPAWPPAAAVIASSCGAVQGGEEAAAAVGHGPSARRRLQLPGEGTGAGLGNGQRGCSEQTAARGPPSHAALQRLGQQHDEASPRRAKSTNDLCGLAGSGSRSPQSAGVAAAPCSWNYGASSPGRSGVSASSCRSCSECGYSGTRPCDCSDQVKRRHGSSWQGHISGACAAAEPCDASSSIWGKAAAGCVAAAGGGGGLVGQSSHQAGKGGPGPQRRGSSRKARGGGTLHAEVLGSGSGTGSGSGCFGDTQVPRASRWTRPSATYRSSTLVLSFRDPMLPQELRRFVKSNMRLLKLYESGLPSWAVFMPCYGLPYRPWMRRALWLLFIAISIFSMAAGFYDLYKNVPFLKQVVTALASRMYLPASELFEWLEHHTQIRMSILLTYMFSKSPLLMSLMRALRSLAALLQQLLAPAVAALTAALQPLGGGMAALAAAGWQVVQPVATAAAVLGREVVALGTVVLGPPVRALWAVVMLVGQLIRLVAALVGMVFAGPLQLVRSVGGALGWMGSAAAAQLAAAWEGLRWVVQWAATLGHAARHVAPAVKAGARAAAQAAGTASAVAGSAGGAGVGMGVGASISNGMAVWQWLGLEVVGAYNAVRLTFVRAFKSAQAVMNFCVTVANTAVQHRVSLLLQLRRFITRQKERLPPAMAASVPLPAFVSMPSFELPTPAPVPGLLVDSDQGLADLEPASPTAVHHHPVFDLGMDLIESEPSGESELPDAMALERDEQHQQQQRQQALLYGGGVAGVLGRGSSRPEPIPVPSRSRSSTGILRRRHVGGSAPATRGGLRPMSGGFGAMYGSSFGRLDAVDEEELEEADLTEPSGFGSVDTGVSIGGLSEHRSRSVPSRQPLLGAGAGPGTAAGDFNRRSQPERQSPVGAGQGQGHGRQGGDSPWLDSRAPGQERDVAPVLPDAAKAVSSLQGHAPQTRAAAGRGRKQQHQQQGRQKGQAADGTSGRQEDAVLQLHPAKATRSMKDEGTVSTLPMAAAAGVSGGSGGRKGAGVGMATVATHSPERLLASALFDWPAGPLEEDVDEALLQGSVAGGSPFSGLRCEPLAPSPLRFHSPPPGTAAAAAVVGTPYSAGSGLAAFGSASGGVAAPGRGKGGMGAAGVSGRLGDSGGSLGDSGGILDSGGEGGGHNACGMLAVINANRQPAIRAS